MVESQIEFIITLKGRGMKRAAICNYISPVISFCKINDIRIIFHSPEIYLGGVLKGHYNDIIENARGIVRELNSGLGMVLYSSNNDNNKQINQDLRTGF